MGGGEGLRALVKASRPSSHRTCPGELDLAPFQSHLKLLSPFRAVWAGRARRTKQLGHFPSRHCFP